MKETSTRKGELSASRTPGSSHLPWSTLTSAVIFLFNLVPFWTLDVMNSFWSHIYVRLIKKRPFLTKVYSIVKISTQNSVINILKYLWSNQPSGWVHANWEIHSVELMKLIKIALLGYGQTNLFSWLDKILVNRTKFCLTRQRNSINLSNQLKNLVVKNWVDSTE